MAESLLKGKSKTSKSKPIKFCNVANAPILPDDVMTQLHGAVAQFLGTQQWYDWGLKTYRKQGPLILMYGPPGCGKTISARYLTQLIKRPLAALDMGTFGSSAPGEAERNISQFFANAQHNHATVFLDEADGVLWSRDKAGGDSMWMVSIINKLLTELADYRDLAIIATNRKTELDAALMSRVIADVEITRPDFMTRARLWANKIPPKYPLQLSHVQLEMLAQHDLSGRTIEAAVVKEAQLAILQGREPEFDSLCNVAKSFQGK